jgi:hypothetical protein
MAELSYVPEPAPVTMADFPLTEKAMLKAQGGVWLRRGLLPRLTGLRLNAIAIQAPHRRILLIPCCRITLNLWIEGMRGVELARG